VARLKERTFCRSETDAFDGLKRKPEELGRASEPIRVQDVEQIDDGLLDERALPAVIPARADRSARPVRHTTSFLNESAR
jgi:hypothetical protein